MNVMQSSMDITDEIYSQLGDNEIRSRIDSLSRQKNDPELDLVETFALFQEFLAWRKSRQK